MPARMAEVTSTYQVFLIYMTHEPDRGSRVAGAIRHKRLIGKEEYEGRMAGADAGPAPVSGKNTKNA